MYIGNVGNIQPSAIDVSYNLRCMYIGNVGNIQRKCSVSPSIGGVCTSGMWATYSRPTTL